jgi:DNA-binding response OmpR family regulator
MLKVLLVEDNFEMSALIEKALSSIANVHVAYLKKQIEDLIKEFSYDLIILDLNLPDCHGFEIFRLIKQIAVGMPAIFVVSSDNSEKSQIEGFQLGIDDYITKPIKINVLKAKILNKLKIDWVKSSLINFGPLSVDLNSFKAFINRSEPASRTPVDLTPIEFKILVSLLKHHNQVVTRKILLSDVWNNSVFLGNRVIDQHVSSLRKKLGEYNNLIKTIYGSGYKVEVQNSGSENMTGNLPWLERHMSM